MKNIKTFTKYLSLFLFIMTLCLLTSCKKPEKENPIDPDDEIEEITFVLPSTLKVHETHKIVGIESDYEVKSTNDEIIKVHDDYTLEALSVGKAIITITYVKNQEVSKKYNIEVLDELSVELPDKINQYALFEPLVSSLSEGAVKDYTLKSSDESILKVVNGKLDALNPGKSTITVTRGEFTYSKEIEVEYDEDAMKVELPKALACYNMVEVLVYIENRGYVKDFTVTSSNTRSIKYNAGYLNSYRVGESTIEITYGTITKSYTINVINELYLEVPEEIRVFDKVDIKYSNAMKKNMSEAIITSSNPEILNIIDKNQIEGLDPGTVTITLEFDGMKISKEVKVTIGYKYEYKNALLPTQETIMKIVDYLNNEVTNFTLSTTNNDIIKIANNKITALKEGTATLTIEIGEFKDELEIMVIGMEVSAASTMKRGGIQDLSIDFIPNAYSEGYTLESSNPEIIEVVEKNRIRALKPGTADIVVVSASGLRETVTITVEDVYYSITFNITDEEKALLPEGYLDTHQKFSIDDLPIALPNMEKEMSSFLGWKINNNSQDYDLEDLTFEIPVGTNYNVTLTSVWGNSHIELYHENVQVIEPEQTLKLLVKTFMIPKGIDVNNLVWESANEKIATVKDGIVTGVGDGTVLIKVSLKEKPNINTTIGVTIMSNMKEMDELLNYFVENAIDEVIAKNITVTGYQFIYQHRLLGSVTKYLFTPFVVNNDFYPIPSSNANRPGVVYPKYYITVHDTASSAETADGKAHARYVTEGGGGTSWHYSVGNDGIYHQIPDNENAYHAGDGGRPYILYETGVKAENTTKLPVVTISEDGYYEINGSKTKVLAPTNDGKILTTKDINDVGIRTVVQNGYYYIGNTYYNATYHKISNAGGNNNSIGMETMVNKGSDLYLTWHNTAKLVANLMYQNNLGINDVRPHHFFSGKNCPQTMRDNGLWGNFITMVQFEYDILTKFKDYKITFESHDLEYLNNVGRVIKQDKYTKTVTYTITVTKNGVSKSVTLSSNIPGSLDLKDII